MFEQLLVDPELEVKSIAITNIAVVCDHLNDA